ncbi:MAG: response regulator [Eubacteriales bacterium]|nr:response regulator [Eubacteriales bacterium]
MKILMVDDEIIALKNLELKINKCTDHAEIVQFTDPEKALNWLKDGNRPDVIFMDIMLGNHKVNGLDLAVSVRTLYPDSYLIFATGYETFAVKAFRIKADGYLVKPVGMEELQAELEMFEKRRKKSKVSSEQKEVRVQCFGNFDVYVKGQIVHFRRSKSKEVFAYLVDRRGSSTTMSELASIIWEDGMYDKMRNRQLHTYIHDMILDFEKLGIQGLVVKSRNQISVNTELFQCDYYDYLSGNEEAGNAFCGEYMMQYSWAEVTLAQLVYR